MALSDYPWVATRLGGCKLFELLVQLTFVQIILRLKN